MFQQPFVLNIKQSSGMITLMMEGMITSCKMLYIDVVFLRLG